MDRLDKHFRTLTDPVFARFGHAYAELLRQWPALVGDDLARVSRPERMSRNGKDALTATLTIRVASGHAILVQHDAPRIIERINAAFGHQVVGRLKILQDEQLVPQRAAVTSGEPLSPADRLRLKVSLRTVADERLRESLMKLGEHTLANSRKIGR